MMKRWLLLGLMLVIAIALGGCRLVAANRSVVGSQLVLTTLQDPKTFNPALNQEFPNVFMFTMRGLTVEDGVTGEVLPELAESWEFLEGDATQVSPRGDRRLVFTLRDGLQWSDGTPLTAADVVFTYRDVIFNEKIPIDDRDNFRIGEQGVFPEVRQLDDRRVEFILPEPFAPIVRATTAGATGIGILPKHTLQSALDSFDSNGNPLFNSTWGTDTDPQALVVNGPYQVEQYIPSQRIIFRRNPYYWRRDRNGQPLPHVDRIVWQLSESTDTQLLQFRSGDLDVVGDVRPLRPEYFSLLKREEDRGNFQVLIGGPWSGTTFISFNLNQAKNDQGQPFVDPVKSRWFNRLEFRQAIAHAIDRPRMITNLYRGISQPQDSPISVQSPYYLPPEQGLKTYDYDLEKARQLLLSAGFQYNSNGQLLDSEGNRVQFTLNTNAGNELREAIGAQIKTDLSKLGIQVDFSPIAFQTLIGRLVNSRDWECALIGFTGGVEPHAGANLWTSRGGFHLFNLGPQPGQPPITDWVVSDWERQIDQLFKAGAQELDENKRREIYGEYQRIAQEQLPVIHLVHEIALVAVRDRVQGLKYSGLPTWGLWNIEEIRVEEE